MILPFHAAIPRDGSVLTLSLSQLTIGGRHLLPKLLDLLHKLIDRRDIDHRPLRASGMGTESEKTENDHTES